MRASVGDAQLHFLDGSAAAAVQIFRQAQQCAHFARATQFMAVKQRHGRVQLKLRAAAAVQHAERGDC